MGINCFNCHKELDFQSSSKISRKETCPYCYIDLHSCKMCHYYDKTAYNECNEPMADRVVEKEKANFCDYYQLAGTLKKGPTKADLMAQAQALFKKKES